MKHATDWGNPQIRQDPHILAHSQSKVNGGTVEMRAVGISESMGYNTAGSDETSIVTATPYRIQYLLTRRTESL